MAMAIYKDLLGTDNPWYYDQGFRNVLEDHLHLLRADPATRAEVIGADVAYRFRGDFYGLLNKVFAIPPHLRWIIMRLSGLDSPFDADETLQQVLIPSTDRLEQIRNSHSTTYKLLGQ